MTIIILMILLSVTLAHGPGVIIYPDIAIEFPSPVLKDLHWKLSRKRLTDKRYMNW